MLHRALMGSIERFFGVLVEHYAGAFPVWLAPVQVRLLPVATGHEGYAADVAGQLRAEGLRVDVVDAGDQLGKRIRNAKLEKIPYVLVVGDDDVANGHRRGQPARWRGGARRRRGRLPRPVAFRDRRRAQASARLSSSSSSPGSASMPRAVNQVQMLAQSRRR